MKKIIKKMLLILLVPPIWVTIFTGLYMYISSIITDKQHERAIQEYIEAVNNMSDEEIDGILDHAKIYNKEFAKKHRNSLGRSLFVEEEKAYASLLSVPETDVIAYIEIPAINVRLPIYHYADDDSQDKGCGHWEATSLPVGEKGSHSFLCAHRSMDTAKMFRNLDKLSEGDTFTVNVLNQSFVYEVVHIQVVEPQPTEQEILDNMTIEEDKDYCTLMTCTPYFIDSHRLLVRGKRIE